MTWFQSLREASLQALRELDQLVDRTTERFHEKVMPVVQDAAERLDRTLATTVDHGGRDLAKDLRSMATDLDVRYQQFMIRRIDPLFGAARNAHLEEMVGLEISPAEVSLNRRIAYTAIGFVAIVVGGALVPASLIISVPASFALMMPVYTLAYRSVKQRRRVTYHVVSAISVTGAWLGGFYTAAIAATLFLFMGEKLLMVTEDRSHRGVVSVFSKQPRTAWRLRDGNEEEVPFARILPGDVVVINAGGFIPVDGTVVAGLASIDQQMLTGEAQPVEKSPGDTVFASTILLAGKLAVRVDKAGDQTVAAKIGEILNRTASYQLALQSRGSKLAHDSALPTLGLGGLALAMLVPESALAAINSSFGVSVRVSAPIAMLNLLNIASQNAILLKDGRSLELLSDVDTVLFDKTGTLTLAQPHVVAVHSTSAFDEARLLTLAAAAEHRQTHPIALAILAEAQARGLTLPDISNARYDVGYGIKVELAKQLILVGSDRFMRLSGIEIPPAIQDRWAASQTQGHSFIMVAVDGKLAGAIELQPTIRPEAQTVIQQLKQRGLKMMIVSGDHEEPTRRLAELLGLDRYFAGVLPEGKASLVEQLQAEGRSVCFVGDGINDAIALKKANVSVSLRGATTVATDVAQVVLMQESLRQLPYLFELSEDMERSLKAGYAAGMVPGLLNVAGVFFLGWGYYHALGLNVVSGLVAMGIGMYPLYKHKQALAQANGVQANGVQANGAQANGVQANGARPSSVASGDVPMNDTPLHPAPA
jgi:heavy metal translocating P-type ATPase